MPEQQVRHDATQQAFPVPPGTGVAPGTGADRIATPTIGRTDDEQIDEIVVRLERRYTRDQISSADLDSRVREFYLDFAAARIRSFVSILVERLVGQSIETPSSTL